MNENHEYLNSHPPDLCVRSKTVFATDASNVLVVCWDWCVLLQRCILRGQIALRGCGGDTVRKCSGGSLLGIWQALCFSENYDSGKPLRVCWRVKRCGPMVLHINANNTLWRWFLQEISSSRISQILWWWNCKSRKAWRWCNVVLLVVPTVLEGYVGRQSLEGKAASGRFISDEWRPTNSGCRRQNFSLEPAYCSEYQCYQLIADSQSYIE